MGGVGGGGWGRWGGWLEVGGEVGWDGELRIWE